MVKKNIPSKNSKAINESGNTPAETRSSSGGLSKYEKLILSTHDINFFQEIVETSSESLLILDSDLRVIFANRSFYQNFKVTDRETIGKLIYELGNNQWDIPELRKLLENILPEKQRIVDFLIEHDFETIGKRIMRFNAQQKVTQGGKQKLIVVEIIDITDRKKIEQALELSEERFRRAFETAKDSILLIDKVSGQIVDSNEAAHILFGSPKEELFKKKIWELGFLKDERDFQKSVQELNELGFVDYHDTIVKTIKGELIPSEIYFANRAKVYQCNIRDISERKFLEQTLRESQEQFRIAQDMSPDGFTILRPVHDAQERIIDFTWIYQNAAVARLNGTDPKAVVGQRLLELFPGHRETPLLKAYKQVAESGESCILETDYSGESMLKPTSFRIVVVPMAEDIAILAQDITDRKQAEENQAQTYKLLTNLARLIPSVIYQYRLYPDGSSAFPYSSPGMYSIYEVTPEQVREDATPVFGRLHPEDADRVSNLIFESARTLEEYYCEFRVILPEQGLRWRWSQAHPERTEDGGTLWHGIISDITERKQAEEKLADALKATIRMISATVETRDPYTAGHQRRVTNLAVEIADQLGLSKDRIEGIKMAGLIHDLGKIQIPAEILSKPGKLTDLEFRLIQTHPEIGYRLVKEIDFKWPVSQMILQHHEKMDGSGYPQGLIGDQIILEARILTVADIVEAMSSHRPYRSALGIEKALEQIRQDRGTLLDPDVVDACLKLFKEGYQLPED